MASLANEPLPQLSGRSRLPRTLESEEQYHARRSGRFGETAFRITEKRQQLVADNLDHLLARAQAPQHRLVHRAIADAVDERLHHFEVDVGLEEREANLVKGCLDVVRRQPHFTAQRLEDLLDPGA